MSVYIHEHLSRTLHENPREKKKGSFIFHSFVRIMNISPSQCGSSGCESGWTFYLDQSSYYSQTQPPNEEYVGKGGRIMAEEAAEVDLSMVSDASSGPKHYYDDYDQCSEPVKKRSKAKKKIKEHGVDDDTATSL